MPAGDVMDEAIKALAAEMAAHGTDREAPVRSVMALLGDRWTTLILLVLATGEWRHAELKRVLARLSAEQAISQRVLTLKLRTLERDGFVAREVTGDVPPKVSYRLTPLGQALHDRARGMIDWIKSVTKQIETARQQFDQN
ncbi:MAG: winged helix-turn-helix transcriptional regulator [Novosphingobium sp.]